MTIKEVNTYIAESPFTETLNNIRLTINYFNGSVTYIGLSKIYELIQKENQGWNEIVNIPNFFNHTKILFNTLSYHLLNFTNKNFRNASQIEQYIKPMELNVTQYNSNVFSFDFPETKFLVDVSQEKGISVAKGAYNMIIAQNDNQRAERIGEIIAYEFLNKDSIISERKSKEKQALNKLRNEYEKELASTQTNLTTHIKDVNDKTNEFAKAIVDLKTEKETSFDEWFQTSKNEYLNFQDTERTNLISWIEEKQKGYDALIESSTNKINSLENLYQEKLSLEAPVAYWDRRAAKMNKRGNQALYGLIGLIIISILFLASFFFNAPTDILQKLLNGEAFGIKWMLTSITIISFLAYGMRSLNKLMFSSFHLARDAEERRKLTYVYLALKEQGAVDKEDRHIVLQSLFSRAETGLLKDEASPTMPGTLIDKFTTK